MLSRSAYVAVALVSIIGADAADAQQASPPARVPQTVTTGPLANVSKGMPRQKNAVAVQKRELMEALRTSAARAAAAARKEGAVQAPRP